MISDKKLDKKVFTLLASQICTYVHSFNKDRKQMANGFIDFGSGLLAKMSPKDDNKDF